MGIFRDILNTIFGRKKRSDRFERGGSIAEKQEDIFKKGDLIAEPETEVVHKEQTTNTIGGYSSGDAQPDKSKSCSYTGITQTFCEPNFTQTSYGVCNPSVIIPNRDDFLASKELIEKEKKTDDGVINPAKKKRTKNVIGLKTLSEIKDYLLTNGSIDTVTCQQKFKVKSLHNFIWFLRKDGFKIKTEKVFLQNEIGEKVEATNYTLIFQKQNAGN